ncbi:MAG: electron transfer flavoprotein-ubiquinone oxidoreductase, partial [SAR86 cluster bacterium]|nr:electron transfer flavoprotein-ubiquinone oxidoreductase [SAR86 cluster bacterium]
MNRESMEYDVIIVGAGPAGLSASIKIKQLAAESNKEISVCVIEKGSEVGAHILSGNVFDPKALNELIPNWKELDAPLNSPVKKDSVRYMLNEKTMIPAPVFFMPTFNNHGNYITSLANLCRWLAEYAENLGVEVFPGFPASSLIYEENIVKGVSTGDMGVSQNGEKKESFEEGIDLIGKYTLLAEGCRGHLGKEIINKYLLDEGKDPQHYGIGFKEVWDIDPDIHEEGLVIHSLGWPSKSTPSGSYFYHGENNQAYLGYVVPLDYKNPYISPFEEFQQWKHHSSIKKYLEKGTRVSYGARALIKGGYQSRPKMSFPGGLLIGDDAGTLNFPKIKGTHTAMKSGMLAAETIFEAFNDENFDADLLNYEIKFKESWLYTELYKARNWNPFLHKFGALLGGVLATIDQLIFRGKLPFTLNHTTPDYACTEEASKHAKIEYPKPDASLSFDKLSSVFLSNTNHEEDQPCHLQLKDASIPISVNLPLYDEPAQRYCPAGVYEVVEKNNEKKFVINAQNCVHCKTCDIK